MVSYPLELLWSFGWTHSYSVIGFGNIRNSCVCISLQLGGSGIPMSFLSALILQGAGDYGCYWSCLAVVQGMKGYGLVCYCVLELNSSRKLKSFVNTLLPFTLVLVRRHWDVRRWVTCNFCLVTRIVGNSMMLMYLNIMGRWFFFLNYIGGGQLMPQDYADSQSKPINHILQFRFS